MGDALAVERRRQRYVHDAEAFLHWRQSNTAVLVGRRAVVGAWVRGEGGVDGRYHIVLVLGHGVRVFLHWVWIAGLHGRHMGLHGQQRAVHGRFLIVDVDAAKVASAHVAVHDMAVGEDVGESALVAELAVALLCVRVCLSKIQRTCPTLVKYLQGARSVTGSSECRNGQAFPAWHAPCR